MISKTSERRLAENEVFFRDQNESVHKAIDEVNRIAKENGSATMDLKGDTLLNFYCECSNENCTDRVNMSLDEYKLHHSRRDTFSIRPGHEVENIEMVSVRQPNFFIVIKRINPPLHADTLHPTDIDPS